MLHKAIKLIGCVVALLALAATPALAARPHEFTTTFGVKCLAEPGCTGEELFSPSGVAVNEATGDVYVVDKGEGAVGGRVVRFNKEGVVQGEFDGSEAPTGAFEEPETIAVDNSCVLRKLKEPALTQATCEAEDPSNGDVYVVDTRKNQKTGESPVVDKFSAAGKFLGQISEAGEAGSLPFKLRPVDGVAVDSSGKLWIYRQEAGAVVDEFSNGTPNEFVSPQISLPGGRQAAPGFAVDSTGDFYGAYGPPTQIAKWGPTGNLLIESLDGEGSTGVAVDESTDASFVDSGTTIDAFSPEGVRAEQLGKEGGAKHLTRGVGIGVNSSSESVYVADAGTGTVVVFGPAQATVPKVAGESFAKVGSDRASVAAEINPRSEAGEAQTEYSFQYGRCATATSCASSGYEATTPPGQIAPDFEVHPVSAALEGLQPNTTYHFRALARNAHGEGEPGAEETFTTQSAGGTVVLPDNRGWELVSPPDKQGSLIEPISESGVVQAAADGGAITYLANAPTEASPEGYVNNVQVLSRRSAAAWSSRDIAIAHSSPPGKPIEGEGAEYKFFDPELSLSAVQPFGEFIPQLSAEASEPTAYLHDLGESCGASCYRPLVSGKPGFANVPEGTVFGEEGLCRPAPPQLAHNACGPRFLGATEDLSDVVLTSGTSLVPGALANELYEWSGGALARVSVLPGGGAAGESLLGLRNSATRGAIAASGNRITWTAKGNLYDRDMARGETVQLDAAQVPAGEGGTEKEEREANSGGGQFQVASSDGSRVLFTDTQRLTADSGAGSEKADLYECEITLDGAGHLACVLSDLTPAHGGEAASVQGSVLGASEDASRVYFVAKGVLSEEANARGMKAIAAQPNLYVHDSGGTRFIATLEGKDVHDWSEVPREQPTRASNNGRFLELMSQAQPTGYDNRDVATGKAVAEVYLYDASSNRLSCASCEPSGQRPVGVEYRKLEPGSGGLVGGPRGTWPANALVAANVPGWTAITEAEPQSRHQPRYLSGEGRLFFNSADALVPQDANGTQDVYEYEPPAVGSCSESDPSYSARSGGCVSLISSGASSQEAAFLDASESGDDVFFLTSAKLSPLDVDAARDVYDAHVCSTASPCISYAGNETPPCTTEASCKPSPTPQPSIFGAPASSTFQGLGNPVPAVAVKPKAKPLTRAQKLAAALKVCKKTRGNSKQAKPKRAKCQKAAHSKFGPLKRTKKKRKG